MVARHVNPPEPKCPLCKNTLADPMEQDHLTSELDSRILRKHNELSRQEKGEYSARIHDLNSGHAKEIQTLKRNHKDQQDLQKKRLVEQKKKDNASLSKKLAEVKKNAQTQMRNIREVYDIENLRMQKEAESAVNTQLKEIIKNYGDLALSHQKELERLKKLQDENNLVMRKKDNEIARIKIELAKSTSELQVKELALQIRERDTMIERLSGKIRELEGKPIPQRLSEPRKGTKETQKDEDGQKEKLKEYMRAIIEITKNQQLSQKKSANPGEESSSIADEELPPQK